MTGNFGRIIVADFEYEVRDGDLPDVLCMVAYELDEHLRHVRTIRKWRGEFGSTPSLDIGDDTLVVAYSAWAEMTCFKVLGWQFPIHIFDQHTAYLAASNILLPYNPGEVRKKPRKRLSDACRAYGLDGWERIDKEEISKAIGEGTWSGRYSPQEVVDYCEEDVKMSVKLLCAQLRPCCDEHGHMRAHHAIGIVAVILVGFGLKVLFFSAPIAEADLRSVRSVGMDISQMHQKNKNLPEQKIHDMTFVFSGDD